MASVTATITDSSILSEVAKIASFEGRFTKEQDGSPKYDAVRITTQDGALLESFLAAAKHNIVASYAGVAALNSGNIVITPPSDNALSGVNDSITREVTEYLVNYCCRCWFELRIPSLMEEYQSRAALNILNLNNLVYTRKAPTKGTGENTIGFVNLHQTL